MTTDCRKIEAGFEKIILQATNREGATGPSPFWAQVSLQDNETTGEAMERFVAMFPDVETVEQVFDVPSRAITVSMFRP